MDDGVLTPAEAAGTPNIGLVVLIGESASLLVHMVATDSGTPEERAMVTTTLANACVEWGRRVPGVVSIEDAVESARAYCTEHPEELARFDQIYAQVTEGMD